MKIINDLVRGEACEQQRKVQWEFNSEHAHSA